LDMPPSGQDRSARDHGRLRFSYRRLHGGGGTVTPVRMSVETAGMPRERPYRWFLVAILASVLAIGVSPFLYYWYYYNVAPKEEKLEIGVRVVRKDSLILDSREIEFGFANKGNAEILITKVLANGSIRVLPPPFPEERYPQGLLPFSVQLLGSNRVSIEYKGPWHGSLNVTFVSQRGNLFSQVVQLDP